MSKELVISASRHETRVAVMEDDQVVELYHQRENEYSLAGSIHKGRVTRVLPGMQSAFVDIGLERDAFLYVSDFFEDNEEYDQVVSNVEEQVLRLEKAPLPEIGIKPEPPRVVAAPLEQSAAPLGAPPAMDRDGRDRRGRRPRRRRGKGRGFPDSKYSSPVAPVEIRPQAAGLPEPLDLAEPEEAEELPMLPGESISKYSQSESEPDPVGQVPDLPKPEPEMVTTLHVVPQPAVLEPVEPKFAEPEIPAEALPEVETGQVGNLPHDWPEPVEPVEAASASEEAEQAEAETESESESETEPEPVDEGVEPARIPTSLTAALREQGARYPHRVSRRSRRKMRGPGDGRPEGQSPAPRTEFREAPADQQPAPKQERERPPQPSISDLLREGQEIIVQIAKEPLGQKGARITSYVALPGRFVVYMPTVDHVGVSRKIASDEERQRLKRILQSNRTGIPGGFILRTAGEGKTEEELRADMHFLYNLWMDMRQKAEKKKAPAMVHHDLDLVQRILRDQLTSSFKNVWV